MMDDQKALSFELETLATKLSSLSRHLRGLSIELPQLVNQTNDALAQGYDLGFSTDYFEIVGQCDLKNPLAFQTLLSLETTFPNFHRHLSQTFELQASLQEAFAELSDAALAKLPQKNGAPWRSYYLGECLDILRKWPPEVEEAVPFLTAELDAADLVRVVNGTPRHPGPARSPGFRMQDTFLRLSPHSGGSRERDPVAAIGIPIVRSTARGRRGGGLRPDSDRNFRGRFDPIGGGLWPGRAGSRGRRSTSTNRRRFKTECRQENSAEARHL